MSPSPLETFQKRIMKEQQNLDKLNFDWCSAEPSEENLLIWNAAVIGPEGTPYENGVFNLELAFPSNYPFRPPKVKFLTKIYHPSVKQDTGEICDDLVSGDWKPTLEVSYIMQNIKGMLENPGASDSPLNTEIALQLQKNKEEFIKKAKEYTVKYAI